ncbi:MAG TPA: hypothetical protein VGK30_19490 [Candidatus Binatia bacterium]|jgi:hypothetical protein
MNETLWFERPGAHEGCALHDLAVGASSTQIFDGRCLRLGGAELVDESLDAPLDAFEALRTRPSPFRRERSGDRHDGGGWLAVAQDHGAPTAMFCGVHDLGQMSLRMSERSLAHVTTVTNRVT